MSMNGTMRVAAAAAVLALGSLVSPAPVAAHCDSLDGPVVEAAREALESGRVELVLMWVQPEGAQEIRSAFQRTLKVRERGGEARELADRWFFETLVRVHREGEGAPYTGLKPAGYEPPAGIEAADRTLDDGGGSELATRLGEDVATALRKRYERVVALRDHAPADVEAGRRYVHAYVEFIHFVEEVQGLIHGSRDTHDATDAAGHDER